MAMMHLSEENFTCPKGRIMHKQLNFALTVLIANVNFFEKRMKPDINSNDTQLKTV